MKEREEEREENRIVNFQSASTQEPRNFVRETSELYINDEERLTTVQVG